MQPFWHRTQWSSSYWTRAAVSTGSVPQYGQYVVEMVCTGSNLFGVESKGAMAFMGADAIATLVTRIGESAKGTKHAAHARPSATTAATRRAQRVLRECAAKRITSTSTGSGGGWVATL
jgi:hypothetical protein